MKLQTAANTDINWHAAQFLDARKTRKILIFYSFFYDFRKFKYVLSAKNWHVTFDLTLLTSSEHIFWHLIKQARILYLKLLKYEFEVQNKSIQAFTFPKKGSLHVTEIQPRWLTFSGNSSLFLILDSWNYPDSISRLKFIISFLIFLFSYKKFLIFQKFLKFLNIFVMFLIVLNSIFHCLFYSYIPQIISKSSSSAEKSALHRFISAIAWSRCLILSTERELRDKLPIYSGLNLCKLFEIHDPLVFFKFQSDSLSDSGRNPLIFEFAFHAILLRLNLDSII